MGIRLSVVLAVVCLSCAEFEPAGPADDKILDGPVEGLSSAENLLFIRGDIAFNDEVFTTKNGLGPLFVATSCGTCHPGDGKGHPFTTLTRFGQTDATGNSFLDRGGPQLQHRAIPGFTPEKIPPSATFTRMMPPANTGLGFLDAVEDAAILTLADPNDLDGNGISGVPNWVTVKNYLTLRPNSVPQAGKYIGRFGKKGATYDLLQQTATAYNEDIGIASSYEPIDTYTGLEIESEISNQTILDVVFYLKTLKAPVPRSQGEMEILAGKQIFTAVGCGGCHTQQLTTGKSRIAALSQKTFFPYTDLLLHDMGPGLDDGYTEGSATTAEWRTPPLWGLGLARNSQGGNHFLLHDGRAKSMEEAILLHGGEATASRNTFLARTETERKQLIRFLESL